MIIEIPDGNSIIRWKMNDKDKWKYAEISDLITAYKKRPKGKWIDTGEMEEYWSEEYQCSICGAKDHWHNYCPNCGAEMRGEK